MSHRLFALVTGITLAACATDPLDEDGDASDGKADGAGLTAAEVAGVLRVANEVSAADLDAKAGLDARAVDGIDAHRVGADRKPETADDDKFDDLPELDAVPYVGPIALTKLLAYAKALGWVVSGHRLPGFDETLLTVDSNGKHAIIKVGATFSKIDAATSITEAPLVIRSLRDEFFAVYSDFIASISPDDGKLLFSIAVTAPGDLELVDDGVLYVTQKTLGSIARIDLESALTEKTISLAAAQLPGGKIEPRRLLKIGTRVFVQIARRGSDGRPAQGAIGVINLANDSLEKVIELQGTTASGTALTGINPDFDLVHDAKRNLLIVTCAGNRPASTGMLARIDLGSLTIRDVKRADSGFQGVAAIGEPFSTLFVIYHTSTPTFSSHLFAFNVAADGALTSSGPTLNDAFDGADALSLNRAGTLLTMANSCPAGVCVGGAGLAFFDAKTRAKLPKLMKAELGFEPVIVRFK